MLQSHAEVDVFFADVLQVTIPEVDRLCQLTIVRIVGLCFLALSF